MWSRDKQQWRCHLASPIHHDVWHWLDASLPALPGNIEHLFGGPSTRDVLDVIKAHVAERFDIPVDTIGAEIQC